MSNVKRLPQPARGVHKLMEHLPGNTMTVVVIGCGGNGAQMLTKLARLNHALCELAGEAARNPAAFVGSPIGPLFQGLHVIAYDPDIVSPANVGRQLFSPSDVGQYKAAVLINRLNAFYGLQWQACPQEFTGTVPSMLGAGTRTAPDLMVTCVDTAKARRIIHHGIEQSPIKPAYWLDLGNKRAEGQVILGQPFSEMRSASLSFPNEEWAKGHSREALLEWSYAQRLPIVTEVFPELLDENLEESNEPSCSLADALSKQSLFVNDAVTSYAAHLLDTLIRLGQIEHHGAFLNLETGRTNPLPVPYVPPLKAKKTRAPRAKVAA